MTSLACGHRVTTILAVTDRTLMRMTTSALSLLTTQVLYMRLYSYLTVHAVTRNHQQLQYLVSLSLFPSLPSPPIATKALQDAGINYSEIEQAVVGYVYGMQLCVCVCVCRPYLVTTTHLLITCLLLTVNICYTNHN